MIYKFTIIAIHYDQSISDEVFLRGMNSLKNQSFKDFEVILLHDGPTSREIPDIDLPRLSIIKTGKRYNDYGHSLRDIGIKRAQGEYIVHFNIDNILYPNALECINNEINKDYFGLSLTNDIIIFPVFMRGMFSIGTRLLRSRNLENDAVMIFTGWPPQRFCIDAMQLVMKTNLWRKEGGWFDKSEQSDGNMYPLFVQKYGSRYCSEILGEHY